MTEKAIPYILDFEGRPFVPNQLCARRGWMQTEPLSLAVPDRSLLWLVVFDGEHLYLVARPDGFKYQLDPEAGQHGGFFSYSYAPEIDPEGFPEEWAAARMAGWEVLAEASQVVPDLLQLTAFNRSKGLQVRTEHSRSAGMVNLGKLMWRELMEGIAHAKPSAESLPPMRRNS